MHKNFLLGSPPLALQVFVAGRNRLENEGAKALASVFQKLTSLEEVVMPQNGIYHEGITAIANGLSSNPGLRILNLNDNTVGLKGAQAIAKALPNFQNLEQLNLGDCLLKTQGGVVLAEALGVEGAYPLLTELNLSYNEIGTKGANPLALAVADKEHLVTLQLDGNLFGQTGRTILRDSLTVSERIGSLSMLSDNSDDDDDDDDNDDDDDEEEDSNDEDEENVKENEEENEEENEGSDEKDDESEDESKKNRDNNKHPFINDTALSKVTVAEFLKSPIGEKLLLLQGDIVQDFVNYAKVSK